jgi:hypothetical protein
MIKLRVEDIAVASYNTSDASFAVAAACTPTLDSLVEHLCPDGEITNTCQDETQFAA